MKKIWLCVGLTVLVFGMQVSAMAQYYLPASSGANRFDDYHFDLGNIPFNDEYLVTDSLNVKSILENYNKNPQDVDANLAMARYDYRRNRDRNAQKILEGLLTFTDQTVKVYLEFGAMAMKQKNLEKAREWFNKVIQWDPENTKANLYLAASYARENPAKSIAYLEKSDSTTESRCLPVWIPCQSVS